MSLVDHAKYELELAGLFDADADYDDMVGGDVMELINVFARQGHSGGSAAKTIALFAELAYFRPLSELTDSKYEWNEVSAISGLVPGTLWQSRRRPDAFSQDGGKTYYLVSNPTKFFASKKL